MTNTQVIAITATWCQPCKNLKPFLNKLAEQYPIQFIDLEENPEIAAKYGVQAVPSIVYDNGTPEVQFNPSPRELREKVEATFNGNPGREATTEGSTR